MDYSKYFPIVDYYEKFVISLNPSRYFIKSDKMMVCPLHDDHDPSMGIVKVKSGGETCHCFGCNAWVDVVELHKRVCRRQLKKYLSDEDAIKDLCRIFDVDYGSLPKGSESGSVDKEIQQDVALMEALQKFDLQDYRVKFLEGKRNKKGVGYFNTLLMVMVNELKNE